MTIYIVCIDALNGQYLAYPDDDPDKFIISSDPTLAVGELMRSLADYNRRNRLRGLYFDGVYEFDLDRRTDWRNPLPPSPAEPPPIHAPGLDGQGLCPLCLETHSGECVRAAQLEYGSYGYGAAQPIVPAHAQPDLETDVAEKDIPF